MNTMNTIDANQVEQLLLDLGLSRVVSGNDRLLRAAGHSGFFCIVGAAFDGGGGQIEVALPHRRFSLWYDDQGAESGWVVADELPDSLEEMEVILRRLILLSQHVARL